MLVLAVKQGGVITIGSTVIVTVIELGTSVARLDVFAPPEPSVELTIKTGAEFTIGVHVTVKAVLIRPSLIKLGIDAPPEIPIELVEPG